MVPGRYRILYVGAEPSARTDICNGLTTRGHVVTPSANIYEAPSQLKKLRAEAVILDFSFPADDALALLNAIHHRDPALPVLALVPPTPGGLGVRAITAGASRYLVKPLICSSIHDVLLQLLSKREGEGGRREQGLSGPMDPFIGTSPSIRKLHELCKKVVWIETPILLQGETGSGKGVLANWIHRNGPRAKQPFLDLNCAGLSRELLESELFGHEKGAFTSAEAAKQGLLEIADQGTVFLDEIGDIDLQVQPKLLKVLEDRTFRRVGDTRDRTVDVRLISATHRELMELVQQQRFREDLYFRIRIVPIRVPALRERLEDIPLLVEELLQRLSSVAGLGEIAIERSAVQALQSYPWVGNIRELRNVLERSLLLMEGHTLRACDLQLFEAQRPATAGADFMNGTLREMERAYIDFVLRDEAGSIDRSARRLGIPRSSLYAKMKRHAIPNGTGRIKCSQTMNLCDSAMMEL